MTTADKATILANSARARHKRSRDKTRCAVKLRALEMIAAMRRAGMHFARKHERALRAA